METKFTKGEFKIIPSDHIGITTVSLGDFNGSVEFWHHHGNSGTQEEAEANANLFISSPDMFKSIVKLQEWSKKYPPGRVYGYGEAATIESELTEIVEEQLKAIKKAVGSNSF